MRSTAILLLGAISHALASSNSSELEICNSGSASTLPVQELTAAEIDTGTSILAALKSSSLLDRLLNAAEQGVTLDQATIMDNVLAFPFLTVPFVMFIITLVICPFFFIARCCLPNRCCRPKKPQDEFSFCSRMYPLVTYFLFSAACIACSIVGLNGVQMVSDGMVGSICVIFGDLEEHITGDLVPELVGAVNTVGSSINTVGSDFDQFKNDSDVVGTTVDTLLSQVDALSTRLAGTTPPQNMSSSYLTDVASEISTMHSELQNAMNPIVSELSSVLNSVESSISDAKAQFDSATGELVPQMEAFSLDSDGSLAGTIDTIKTFTDQTTLGSYILYGAVFIAFVAGTVAVVSYLFPCRAIRGIGKYTLTLSWSINYCFMVGMFLLSGIFIPVSLLFSDVCIELEDHRNIGILATRFVPSMNDGLNITGTFNGCFNNVTLMESLNVLESLDTSSISSMLDGDALDVSGDIDLSELDAFVANTTALVITDMGIPANMATDTLAALNGQTSADSNTYTRSQCTTTDSCDATCLLATCAPAADNPSTPSSVLDPLRSGVIDAIVAEDEANAILTWLKADVLAINATGYQLKDHAAELGSAATTIAQDTVSNLLDNVDTLLTSGNCAFLAEDYAALRHEMCGNFSVGLGLVSLTLFLVAVFSLPIVILSVILTIRLFGTGSSGFVEPAEFIIEDV